MKAFLLSCVVLLGITLCVFAADKPEEKLKPSLDAINQDALTAHTKILSSNEFKGPSPGTKGEELSIKYISDQFKSVGLKPGNPDGSYFQEVPLAGIKSDPHMAFIVNGKPPIELKYPDDFVASSARLQPEIKVDNSDLIFVGYGVVAPEYGWDDYKGVDVRGKTIVMLINDPAVPDPKDPSKLDEKMFKGKAMTYYGRWTYKYEIAAQKGAAAAIIVHETSPAGYPYEVVKSSWAKENFDIKHGSRNAERVAVEAWLARETAEKLCALGGRDLAELKKAALSKEFKPVALDVKASFDLRNTLREVDSQNV